MAYTNKWFPRPTWVTIEELYKKEGFTRTMFTGKYSGLSNVLCLGEKDKDEYQYYDCADCEPYDKSAIYTKGERVIVKFGSITRDDLCFVKHESDHYFKYEITIRGIKQPFILSLYDYLRLFPDDRDYIETLPKVSIQK
jgi:hypothetical protein